MQCYYVSHVSPQLLQNRGDATEPGRYGKPFVEHSYTYHITRIDHRHNFSVYNTLLHLSSLRGSNAGFRIESLAFIPQLSLVVLAIPLLLAKVDLASTMLIQTFAFVTFNKVCTSQVSFFRSKICALG